MPRTGNRLMICQNRIAARWNITSMAGVKETLWTENKSWPSTDAKKNAIDAATVT